MTVHKLKPYKLPTAEEIAATERRRLSVHSAIENDIHVIRVVSAAARALQSGDSFECRNSAVWYLDQHLQDLIEGLYAKYHAEE